MQGISSLAKELLVSHRRFGFKELVSISDSDKNTTHLQPIMNLQYFRGIAILL